MTGQGQRTNAVTEWAHCQRQVAFLAIPPKMLVKMLQQFQHMVRLSTFKVSFLCDVNFLLFCTIFMLIFNVIANVLISKFDDFSEDRCTMYKFVAQLLWFPPNTQ